MTITKYETSKNFETLASSKLRPPTGVNYSLKKKWSQNGSTVEPFGNFHGTWDKISRVSESAETCILTRLQTKTYMVFQA